MGAIQGQDYAGGEWSIGIRLPGSNLGTIEEAIAEAKIVRTWGLRGTLHFLTGRDIRWILTLLAPGIVSRLARRYGELELDGRTISKAESILAKSLEGNRHLTRNELVAILERKKISCRGQRAVFILHRASLDRIICFGITRGKQQTHTLFDEWVPASKSRTNDESLSELALRYFTSHGPATTRDFMWWSGLRAGESTRALEMSKRKLVPMTLEGKTYWMSDNRTTTGKNPETIHLLPPFDEFIFGYKDRQASIMPEYAGRLRGGGMPDQTIMCDGKLAGRWERSLKKHTVSVRTTPFIPFNRKQKSALRVALERYGDFIGKKFEAL